MKKVIRNKTIGTIDKIPNNDPNVDNLLFSLFLYRCLLQIKHSIITQEQYMYRRLPKLLVFLIPIIKIVIIITEHMNPMIPNINVINP